MLQILSWGPNINNILGMNRLSAWLNISLTLLIASHDSLGHHQEETTFSMDTVFMKHLYAFEILYSLGMTCVKLSV